MKTQKFYHEGNLHGIFLLKKEKGEIRKNYETK